MKIGLALSGGGVLSMAHLGILKELDKKKIKIELISGTSAGAIVGALYADGGIKRIENFLDDLKKEGLFKNTGFNLAMPNRVFATLRKCLERNLKAKNFSDLKIKYVCAATDIVSGRPVFLSKGNLINAIMASSAYLAVFDIQEIHNQYLVDGGICRSMPAEMLRELGVDFIIGSSLYVVPKMDKDRVKNKKLSRIEIAFRAISIMQKELALYEAKSCDFCFYPPVDGYRWYSFEKIEELTQLGQKYARNRIPKLLKLIKDQEETLSV